MMYQDFSARDVHCRNHGVSSGSPC